MTRPVVDIACSWNPARAVARYYAIFLVPSPHPVSFQIPAEKPDPMHQFSPLVLWLHRSRSHFNTSLHYSTPWSMAWSYTSVCTYMRYIHVMLPYLTIPATFLPPLLFGQPFRKPLTRYVAH